jgi:hypothetical protein
MSSNIVREEARKIQEASGKLQHMTTESDIKNELEKIRQYCTAIEARI